MDKTENSQKTTNNWQWFLFIIMLPSILSSCAISHISTRASTVKLLTAEQVQVAELQCEFVGNVTGNSFWRFYQKVAYNDALNELIDNAAELGATHVFVNLGNYRDLRGEAYFCGFCQVQDGVPDEDKCEDQDGNLYPDIKKKTCLAHGYIWIKRAKNRMACEAKGYSWLPDPDVLRKDPFGQALNEDNSFGAGFSE